MSYLSDALPPSSSLDDFNSLLTPAWCSFICLLRCNSLKHSSKCAGCLHHNGWPGGPAIPVAPLDWSGHKKKKKNQVSAEALFTDIPCKGQLSSLTLPVLSPLQHFLSLGLLPLLVCVCWGGGGGYLSLLELVTPE